MYYSFILAQWFKQKYGPGSPVSGLRSEENPYIKLIDSGNLTSIFQLLTTKQPYSKGSYFQQYQKSFAEGEYNLQEPAYTPYGQSIRRYYSMLADILRREEEDDKLRLSEPALKKLLSDLEGDTDFENKSIEIS